MQLIDLDRLKGKHKVYLVQTPSDKLQLYLYDRLREENGCVKETIIEVKDKKDLKKVKEIAYVDSFMSDKWLISCNLKSISSSFRELAQIISECNTAIFFLVSDNYKHFKGFVETCKKVGVTEVAQFYLYSLRSADFSYLYNKYVQRTNKLTKVLYDYVYQGYNTNIPAVMDLFEALKLGVKFESRRDISDVCGVGGNSIESFILSLIKPPSTTERGMLKVISNRIKAGVDLMSIYKPAKFQSLLLNCVKMFIYLKMLCISGVLYKKLYEIPKGYPDNILKYQRYLFKIKEVPMTRLLRLGLMLNNEKWTSEIYFTKFIYNYYLDLFAYEVVPNIPKVDVLAEYKEQKEKEEKAEAKKKLEDERWEVEQRLEYIKKYGVIRGRELYEASRSKAQTLKMDVKEFKNSEEDAKKSAELFRELFIK